MFDRTETGITVNHRMPLKSSTPAVCGVSLNHRMSLLVTMVVVIATTIHSTSGLIHERHKPTIEHFHAGFDPSSSEPGFELLFQGNPDEYSDVPITFSNCIPSWLLGTLVRNGPGLYKMGDRTVLHMFDGFAKLTSWKLFGNTSGLFSTKFIESDFYKASKKMNKIAPYGLFHAAHPPFSLREGIERFINGIDNMNINIFRFVDSITHEIDYAAVTDSVDVYKVDINDLSTIRKVLPDMFGKPHLNIGKPISHKLYLSSSHPLPEQGTSNHINFFSSFGYPGKETLYINVVRITSIGRQEIIADWPVHGFQMPIMHSFGLTETKAILIAHPLFLNNKCLDWTMSAASCLEWDETKPTTLYVVELKSGNLTTLIIPRMFVVHVINAYDLSETSLILDAPSYSTPSMIDQLDLRMLRNERLRNSMDPHPRFIRLHLDLVEKQVTEICVDYPKPPSTISHLEQENCFVHGSSSLASHLELPAVNENFRSKKYCFVYGLVFKADYKIFSTIAIVKKDLCNGGRGDVVRHVPGHYPAGPWFEPRPGATEEDDGVLLVPVLDGERKASYLAVVDARTLDQISRAYLPIHIPMSFHGRFFKKH